MPKAFVVLAGRPMLEWSLDALRAVDAVDEIVVALPPGADAPAGTTGVAGGEHRSQSVRVALSAARGDPVVVHDAARPLVTPRIVRATLEALSEHDCDGAIAAAPVTDTIKEAADGQVTRTVDRAALWAIQTPQAFRREALERALSAADDVLAAATDDAWLVERAGGVVRIVPAPAENLKVTTAADLRRAELMLGERGPG
ncbi:MAG: 2-C-methyl-D-erythritol 4-phosphate cytidylyltransferase [Actinomycetota bacterium]|nr:2-C-methyl-D-erythritol 4-phosphate cytidylyltransferase [Actinomycetota bacterium]